MNYPNEESLPYPAATLEFVKISAEFCKQMETVGQHPKEAFLKNMLVLLPMLYLKTQFLSVEEDAEGYTEDSVSEDDYNFVRSAVANKLGSDDDYLTTRVDDFKYSENPVLRTVSEDLADLYQVLRNFLEVFRAGYSDAINAELAYVVEEYRNYWGSVLLNALSALHLVETQRAEDE